MAKIGAAVDGLLSRTGVDALEIDRVFLTGGSSLVPIVREIFVRRFAREKISSGSEFTSVARGLAARAREESL